MREKALRGRPRRRGLPADTGERSRAAITANVLDRQFEASAPNQRIGYLHLDSRRVALRGGRHQSVFTPGRGLVDERGHDGATGSGCADDGDLASFQPGQPIHQ